MSQGVSAPMFGCTTCGKQFKWKSAIAGKQAKCSCGSVVQVPAQEPNAPAPEPHDDFGLEMLVAAAPAPVSAPRPVTVRTAPKAKPAASKPGATGFRPGQKSGGSALIERSTDGMSFWGTSSQRNVAFIILAIGAVLTFGGIAVEAGESSGMFLAMAAVALFYAVTMILGAFVSASVQGISFGPMGIAILRLTAICFAVVGVDMVFENLHFTGAGIVAWVVRVGLLYGLMMKFFQLEFSEVLRTVIITGIIRFLCGLLIIFMVIKGILTLPDELDEGPDHKAKPGMVDENDDDDIAPADKAAGDKATPKHDASKKPSKDADPDDDGGQ